MYVFKVQSAELENNYTMSEAIKDIADEISKYHNNKLGPLTKIGNHLEQLGYHEHYHIDAST